MKKLAAIVLLGSLVLLLSACNTIRGVGKDVQKAGEVVEDAASKK
jgi:predicted small secreted protein